MPLKISTWNVEHAKALTVDQPSSAVADRIGRVHDTIQSIDPDILLMVEGPRGEADILKFCDLVLQNQWLPVLLKGANDQIGDCDRDYGNHMGGTQWLWFLVKPAIAAKCRLQAASVWQSFVNADRWRVNYWGKIVPENYKHYRHPQVLVYQCDNGQEIECIGVHLKSKINLNRITRDAHGNLTGKYIETALKARVKLATQARNIRHYVNAKFNQLEAPGIIILGDCNDGPGQDFFETQYLFFDLIQNLQGDVMLAEQYFNHGLFDYAADLRWTAKYRDAILGLSANDNPLLIDHILMSQPLCDGSFPLEVNAKAGKVEHEIFERANAGSNRKTRTSDHRPVSLTLTETALV
ncbi:endonuclease/exonuclease/phosphatase family protein [Winogradskyella schleiferi]|uniref:endonuclease/exonuclease/phosphatase family protein n=1 Tax=Winogradskyella schleiferi TaxID=2686078 RepID=UPI0015B894AD|nr:endonuclease/exonuclease/phosphatase family protein [Winogradskyella schleiferi]